MLLGRSKLAVLRERNFRLFFIGQSASVLGDSMVVVALAFAVLGLTGSPADLGYVLAARSLPFVATLLFGGVIADRFSRRGVMLGADVARALSQGTMAVLLIGGDASIGALAALQAVHGASSALFNPASTGLVPAIVSAERLSEANALRGLTFALGDAAGPALAGFLVVAVGPGWAIAADAATYALSAMVLALLRLPGRRVENTQPFARDLLAGWREFSSRRWVWATVVFLALGNMLFTVFLVLGPAVAAQSLGGAGAWAAVMSAFGIGCVGGGLVALHARPRRPLFAGVLAMAVYGLPALGLAAQLPLGALIGLAFLSGAGGTVFNIFWETALQRHIPATALSRVSAYDWFGSFACHPVGQASAGPIAAGLGVTPALWLAGVIQVFITGALLMVPEVRRLSSTRAQKSQLEDLDVQ